MNNKSLMNISMAVWHDGEYRCTVQTMGTAFGEYMWHVTHMAIGNGYGGFARTEAEGREKIAKKLAELRGGV